MAKAIRVCTEPGCPELVAGGRCDAHRAAYERQRGTRQQRGYTAEHDRLRRRWKPKVEACTVHCARCGQLILPGAEWALDHNDERTGYIGPSHKACNDSAGGKAAHQ